MQVEHNYPEFISEKVRRGGEPHIREILGGNMKTHVAVYEESLFDLRGGGKTFLRGANAPSAPPPKEPLLSGRSVLGEY